MKIKFLTIILFLLSLINMASFASADVTLEIVIPDTYISRAIDSLTIAGGKNITIALSVPEMKTLIGKRAFYFKPKEDTETNIEFGQRFLRTYFLNMIRLTETAEDAVRFKEAISNIPPASSDLPDSALE